MLAQMSQEHSNVPLNSTLSQQSNRKNIENLWYQDEIRIQSQLNVKLKQVQNNLKNKMSIKQKNLNDFTKQGHSTDELKFKLKKKEIQIQHQNYLLNLVIAENKKLQTQVNNNRNVRVIYSNVYKNMQKDLRKWEDIYKNLIIQQMASQGGFYKIRQRLNKNVDKFKKSKDIWVKKAFKVNSIVKEDMISRLLQSNQKEQSLNNQEVENRKNFDNNKLIETNNMDRQKYQRVFNVSKIRNKYVRQNSKIEINYQEEMEMNWYNNMIKRLQNITGLNNIDEIIMTYKTISSEINKVYQEYIILENNSKKIQQSIKIKEKIMQQCLYKSQSYQSVKQKIVQDQIQKQKLIIRSIEEKIQTAIDFNCSQMSQIDIQQEFIRKYNKQKKDKNIDKILQIAAKDKSVDSHLLTTKQMYEFNIKLTR